MTDFKLTPPPEPESYEDRKRNLERRAREISGDGVLFNEASWNLVLDLIEEGYTVDEINDNNDLPSWSTIRRWIRSEPERLAQYRLAREFSADTFESQILGLAKYTNEATEVAAAKFKFDVLKFAMSKRAPKQYGDKISQELTGADGKALQAPTLVIAPYVKPSTDTD